MTNYIDAEKLKKIVEQAKQRALKGAEVDEDLYCDGRADAFGEVLLEIDSLQKEQSDDVVTTANVLLEALSKTPYNNKPITDAQIIVRQLLLFFENPKEYNPDAILDQTEVDFEKELRAYLNSDEYQNSRGSGSLLIARHFYELGRKGGKVRIRYNFCYNQKR